MTKLVGYYDDQCGVRIVVEHTVKCYITGCGKVGVFKATYTPEEDYFDPEIMWTEVSE